MSSNYCVSCGCEIPEGRQVCPACERNEGPCFCEYKNAYEYGKERGWAAYDIVTGHEGCHQVVERPGAPEVLMIKKNEFGGALNEMCAEFCRYPEEYASIYCDDPDEAEERLGIEKCENCPMQRIYGGLKPW